MTDPKKIRKEQTMGGGHMTIDSQEFFGRGKAAAASDETLDALNLITKERFRQITQEGYTPAHDDEHTESQLAVLAAVYALSSAGPGYDNELTKVLYTLDSGWSFKPKDPISDLTRAGALVLAELERRLRMKEGDPSIRETQDWKEPA
jgi:hypothetical protein